jgi:hypothetical protein
VLNVRPNQLVQLHVVRRLHEDYIPPKSGSSSAAVSSAGHRQGVPKPKLAGSSSIAAPSNNTERKAFGRCRRFISLASAFLYNVFIR